MQISLPTGEGFALGAAICWALGPLIAHRGVSALGVFRFSQYRYFLSATILAILTAGFGSFTVSDNRSVILLITSGIVGVALGEASLFQAVYLIGPRMASLIFSLHAPITAFLGAAIFGETISLIAFSGIVLSVAGVYAAILFRAFSEKAGGHWWKPRGMRAGVFFAVAAIAFQVIGALLSKEAIPGTNPIFASFLRTGSAAIAFLPLYLRLREGERSVKATDFRIVLYSSTVSTVGGMTLLLAAFAYTEIFRAVVIVSLSPVLYILIMRIVRGEKFPVGAWVGTLAAVSGVILTIANL